MAFSKQQTVAGLSATGTPDNPGVSGRARIGNTDIDGGTTVAPLVREYPLADIVYAFQVQSAAIANVATLTLTTGAVAQTTGSPLINGVNAAWAAVDFEGDAIGSPAKLCAIRLRTKADNTGTVTVAGSSSGVVPAVTLSAGADLLLTLPAAGQTASGTVTFTFSAASDDVWVEILAVD